MELSYWPLVFAVVCLISVQTHGASTCGYESCPEGKKGVINVHLVPHTHDDVGWLKTVDQYYYGSSTRYQRAGVQYTIDSIIKELKKSPDRKFIYVEMAFFWQWWIEQTDKIKNDVKKLVNDGQLEFINGGWCMNDEAATHYNDIVDQMTWGLRFLNDTFGECGRPKVAWQIDPFGHSREQAELFALMGYDGLFFARLDWIDKGHRKDKQEMEMLWEASNSLGEKGSIFTGALYDHYSPPPGFCFDVLCGDEPFIDNPNSGDFNVDNKIKDLLTYIEIQQKSYRTDHIMFTMGNDFTYMSGNMWFKNMDKMIKYTNEKHGDKVNLFYSTPSCYVKAKNEAKIEWPTKTDDFFPYSNDPHAYWTGYFTSRAAFKGMVRKSNTLLQSCKQLHSLSRAESGSDQELIDSLRRSMGEAQHHDAVAGTEKQHVANDYALRLHDSAIDCQKDVSVSLGQLLPIGNQEPLPDMTFCLQLNVSQCQVTTTNDRFVVTAYNPRAQEISSYIRLPVANGAYTVLDVDGSELVSQMMPISSSTKRQGLAKADTADFELIFRAVRLPPLGHKSFYVQKMSGATQRIRRIRKLQKTKISQPLQDQELRGIVITNNVSIFIKWTSNM